MKATELIKQLQKQVSKHGDHDVYYEYDGGIRLKCESVRYRRRVDANEHTEHWGTLRNVSIINYNNS